MDRATKNLFDKIFYQAQVIDFDFSQWDKFMRMVVLAYDLPDRSGLRVLAFNVDFHDVRSLSWESNHVGVELDHQDKHCQWTTYEPEVVTESHGLKVRFIGSGPAPDLEIQCANITLEEVNSAIFDAVTPGWDQPYSPLARPDFLGMYRRIKGSVK